MNLTTSSMWLTGVCAAAVVVLLLAEHRRWRAARIAAKLVASGCFVALALVHGATHSGYGRFVLAGLLLSWLGDALLLSARRRLFLAGIGAFLLAHVAYTVAFLAWGMVVSRLAIAALAMLVAAIATLRWLWPHLSGFYRTAVAAYVATIGAMVAIAVGGSASSPALLPFGAIAFAISDLSVARDRFVAPGFVNKAWGLPLYYAAQCLIACSIASATM